MANARLVRTTAGVLTLAAITACSGAGGLGEVLGGVLGAPQGGASGRTGMAQGSVRALDTRAQQISLQLSDGQSVALTYDNQTKLVYQNQLHPVTGLESGDRIIVRVREMGNGVYYADSIHVTESVSHPAATTGGTASNVQALQGTVRQVDRSRGLFTIDASNNVVLTVSMPYGASRADVDLFNSLRQGDRVRFYGVFLNNSRVELRQFQR